jgi:hypothetical protein
MEISPSQFIEVVLENLKELKVPKIQIDVETFNEMTETLYEKNLVICFGFSGLIEFSNLYKEHFPYENFKVHISYSEELLQKIKRYNCIYESIDKGKIDLTDIIVELIKYKFKNN